MGKIFGSALMLTGVLLIAGAVGLTAYNAVTDDKAGLEAKTAESIIRYEVLHQSAAPTSAPQLYDDDSTPVDNETPVTQSYTQDPAAAELAKQASAAIQTVDVIQTVEINGMEYIGILEFDDLDLSLPILASCSEYALKLAPCLYGGSYLTDDMVIAGHNYRSHFGRLDKLTTGSVVTFTDIYGTVYTYEVTGIESIDGSDVESMKSGDWDLTLFTCDYSGKTRLTIRCELQ